MKVSIDSKTAERIEVFCMVRKSNCKGCHITISSAIKIQTQADGTASLATYPQHGVGQRAHN